MMKSNKRLPDELEHYREYATFSNNNKFLRSVDRQQAETGPCEDSQACQDISEPRKSVKHLFVTKHNNNSREPHLYSLDAGALSTVSRYRAQYSDAFCAASSMGSANCLRKINVDAGKQSMYLLRAPLCRSPFLLRAKLVR